MNDLVKRPLLRYHGAKWMLAPWIISYFPYHKRYVEPYGGSASVLLRKNRSKVEVYNDLDEEIVNLFKVVREHGEKFIEQLYLTPFSRSEFKLSYQFSSDPVERARRTVVRSFFGFGSDSVTNTKYGSKTKGFKAKATLPKMKIKTGFRANSIRNSTSASSDWKNYPDSLYSVIDRLRGVVIENKKALSVMTQQDCPETLFYVDPPYVHGTRCKKSKSESYRYEMDDDDHVELCSFLNDCQGSVVLSCYDNPIYRDILSGWKKVERDTYADGAKKRKETLYIKYSEVVTLNLFNLNQMADA